jgi:hypothetical protein
MVRCTDGRWMVRPPTHCDRGGHGKATAAGARLTAIRSGLESDACLNTPVSRSSGWPRTCEECDGPLDWEYTNRNRDRPDMAVFMATCVDKCQAYQDTYMTGHPAQQVRVQASWEPIET